MFKKNLLFFLFLLVLNPGQSFAGFWDGLAGCIKNPCNCGGGKRDEWWGGEERYKGDENKLCPPWNKTSGRDNGTCLVSTPYPSNFVPFYVSYCAESTRESTYFAPKIRVRSQTCNVACWNQSKTLSWDGQCVIWPGPYGIPMLRICARVAVPENEVPNLDPKEANRVFPADPGYTIGKHLNSEGFEVDDEPFETEDGKKELIPSPKLCAYKDPSLYDLVTFVIDVMDYNPNSQPIHRAQGVHPIAEVLMFFIDSAGGSTASLGSLIGQLMDSIVGVIIPGIDVFKVIFDTVGDIIKYVGNLIKELLTEILQFNRVVDDFKFGCVEIPIGPFPPPYCKKLGVTMPTVTTQPICTMMDDTTNLSVPSSRVNKCVHSNLVKNNAIQNAIRISFDNFIPLCKSGENPQNTDKCVKISNFNDLSAAGMNILTGRVNTIHKCETSTPTPCVNTKIPLPSKGYFRIVYGIKTGSTSTPIGYYVDDDGSTRITPTDPPKPIYDCGDPKAGATCQEIWGVNVGDFTDASITFPKVETLQNPVEDIKRNFTLVDKNNVTRTFNVSIVRQTTTRDDFTQVPSQICVSESGNVVACETRIAPPKPVVYTCSNPPAGVSISCTDNFYTPKFIAALKFRNDITSTVVELHNAHTSMGASPDPINLAGYEFASFATDYSYAINPYTGPHAFNSSSIYGEYKDNKPPYDTNLKPDPTAIYLTGLEYVNDKYIQGGKYACLRIPNIEHCPTNQKMCVLTKLLNKDTVSCTDFFNKSSLYPNLHVCSSSDTGCKEVNSMSHKSGSGKVPIYDCNSSVPIIKNYCYGRSGDAELCKVSIKKEDRENPKSALDTLSDSEFYRANQDQNQKPPQFDKDIFAIRDKTPVELGLCTEVVQPTCAQVTAPSTAYDGWALWPEAEVGEEVSGTCLPDYIIRDASKPLKRYCLSKAEIMQVRYEEIDPTAGCVKQEVELVVGDTDFPTDYGNNVEGDNKEGSVTFGQRADSHRVDGQGKTYYMNLKFKVGHVRGLEYFRIKELTYDDYIVVKVNGTKVYSGPGNYDYISQAPNDEGGVWNDITTMIDLMPKLKDGDNLIRMDIKVVGQGILYYIIEYKFK